MAKNGDECVNFSHSVVTFCDVALFFYHVYAITTAATAAATICHTARILCRKFQRANELPSTRLSVHRIYMAATVPYRIANTHYSLGDDDDDVDDSNNNERSARYTNYSILPFFSKKKSEEIFGCSISCRPSQMEATYMHPHTFGTFSIRFILYSSYFGLFLNCFFAILSMNKSACITSLQKGIHHTFSLRIFFGQA